MKPAHLGTSLSVIFVLLTCPAAAQTLEGLSGTTVYLHLDETPSIVKDGARYETWLKDPTGKNPSVPYIVTKESASGFFIISRDYLFLVTAAHVAKDINQNWSATIRAEGDRPTTYSIPQLAGDTPPKWSFHESADVAVLPLHPETTVRRSLNEHFMPIAILTTDLAAPPRDQPLTALGFPINLGAIERFSPISRQSLPASGLLTLPRSDTGQPATFFLLDSASIDGFSGAPVFTWPLVRVIGSVISAGGKMEIVGLIHGTLSDRSGGKMGAVVPARFIVETIVKAEAAEKK